eukprot:1025253-Pelagomonas_calceolata.AAC.5
MQSWGTHGNPLPKDRKLSGRSISGSCSTLEILLRFNVYRRWLYKGISCFSLAALVGRQPLPMSDEGRRAKAL